MIFIKNISYLSKSEEYYKEQQTYLLKENGWGGRIRTYGTRDQNPLPYRLATPQQYCCNILVHMIQEN